MNFDAFTLSALVDELREAILGGRVQDSLEIGEEAIGLEIYANHIRHYLMISANPQQARVHLVPDRMRRGVEQPSPLGLMLRRYIEGAYLATVEQPAWERVLYLDFDGPEGKFRLIAEPMDRRSNILLLRDGRIMDCLRRVGPDENRVRVSLPGHEYVPPPPQLHKTPPTDLSLDFIAAALDADPAKQAWRSLTDNILAFSPLLAKEAVFRAMQRANVRSGDTSARDLYAAIGDLLGDLLARRWQPGITESDGLISSYAVYPITYLPGWQRVESVSAALARFYGAPVGPEAYDAAKKPILAALIEGRERVQHRLESLQHAYRDESERERLKQSGELILAYQYQIAPGQTSLSAQYDTDAPPLEIDLDPTASALDNAKAYFERYGKAKRAAGEVPALMRAAKAELAYLNQLETDLAIAPSFPEIAEVQDSLQSSGYWRGPRTAQPKGGKSGPLRVTAPDGTVVWVGRNSRQNEDVTFTKGGPEDLWLHARGVPGAHVIIKNGGRPVTPGVIRYAAGLAAYFSASRGEGHVLVDVTERRNVRKIKGAKQGLVTYKGESPVEVTPSAPAKQANPAASKG